MKKNTADKFIKKELADLDMQYGTFHWFKIYFNAIEAAEILNKKELKQLIQDSVELIPLSQRYEE